MRKIKGLIVGGVLFLLGLLIALGEWVTVKIAMVLIIKEIGKLGMSIIAYLLAEVGLYPMLAIVAIVLIFGSAGIARLTQR